MTKTTTKPQPTVAKGKKKVLDVFAYSIHEVLVEQDKLYYRCMWTRGKWKCGKCAFGLINPWGNHRDQDIKCRRCGAELAKTTYGYLPAYDVQYLKEYHP